jgi:hypothetical protein
VSAEVYLRRRRRVRNLLAITDEEFLFRYARSVEAAQGRYARTPDLSRTVSLRMWAESAWSWALTMDERDPEAVERMVGHLDKRGAYWMNGGRA